MNIDWRINWLTDRLTDWPTDWRKDWIKETNWQCSICWHTEDGPETFVYLNLWHFIQYFKLQKMSLTKGPDIWFTAKLGVKNDLRRCPFYRKFCALWCSVFIVNDISVNGIDSSLVFLMILSSHIHLKYPGIFAVGILSGIYRADTKSGFVYTVPLAFGAVKFRSSSGPKMLLHFFRTKHCSFIELYFYNTTSRIILLFCCKI